MSPNRPVTQDHAAPTTGERVLELSGLGQRFVAWRPLVGGVSASVYRLTFVDAQNIQRDAAVRCHGDVDYARNKELAAQEFALVGALYELGVRVPEPLYLGDERHTLGREFAIYRFIDGEVLSAAQYAAPHLSEMAEWLASLHRIDPAKIKHRFPVTPPPRQALQSPGRPEVTTLDDEIFEPEVRRFLGAQPTPAASGRSVFLHGDFWSGNLIWRNQAIAAVIDWEDFGYGDAFADLACARLELLWATSEEAVEFFTRCYLTAAHLLVEGGESGGRESIKPVWQDTLAYWDLCAVLPFAHTLEAISEDGAERLEKRLRLRGFIERAVAQLRGKIDLNG